MKPSDRIVDAIDAELETLTGKAALAFLLAIEDALAERTAERVDTDRPCDLCGDEDHSTDTCPDVVR